jgi:hypothetical protein
MREADDLAVVERLRGILADRSAAFEKQHGFALADGLNGEGNAGGSSSDYADIGDEG